jgi:hypothetical protein
MLIKIVKLNLSVMERGLDLFSMLLAGSLIALIMITTVASEGVPAG